MSRMFLLGKRRRTAIWRAGCSHFRFLALGEGHLYIAVGYWRLRRLRNKETY